MGKKAVDWVSKGKLAVARYNDCTFFYRDKDTVLTSLARAALPKVFDEYGIAWRVRPAVPGETLDGDGSDLKGVNGSGNPGEAGRMWTIVQCAIDDGWTDDNEWFFDIMAEALVEVKRQRAEGGTEADETLLPVADIENVQRSTPNAQRSTMKEENGYRMIDLRLIDASPYQQGSGRGDEEADPEVLELAASIIEVGLCEPMIVRAKGERFELIAGHRRLAACRIARRKEERCVVRDVSDAQAEELHVIENLQRKDLSAVEESQSVARMLANGRTPEDVARATGKSVRWVYRRASITTLSAEWMTAAMELKLSAAFLERIGRLPVPIQTDVYKSMGVDAALNGSEAFADADFLRGGDCMELDRHIKAQLREISGAAFNPECSECRERTDAARDLFEDYAGSPRCLNAACWGRRLDAHVAARRKELKRESPQVIEATSRNANLYSGTRSLTCTVPVIVTEGPRKGETLWAPGETAAAEKPKGPGPKDRERETYVRAVYACIESAKEPVWLQDGKEAVEVPHAGLVALACGCGVSQGALVSGAYSGPLQRSMAIYKLLAKAGTLKAERAALWLSARPNVLKALDMDGREFSASAWESMEGLALEVSGALGIPDEMVAAFVAELAPKGKGKGKK